MQDGLLGYEKQRCFQPVLWFTFCFATHSQGPSLPFCSVLPLGSEVTESLLCVSELEPDHGGPGAAQSRSGSRNPADVLI